MKKRKIKVDHQKIAIFIALFLTLITILSIQFTSEWSIRNIYNVFFFLLLNLSILLSNALVFSRKRRFFPERLRKPWRISVIVVYVFIYLVATGSYLTTGQITRLQTLVFLMNMRSLWSLILIVIGILIGLLILIAFIFRKSNLKDYSKKESKKLLRFVFVIRVLLVLTILLNLFFLQLEHPLITDRDRLINYRAEDVIIGKNISKLNQTTEDFNIVFIMLESITAERLGVYGYKRNVSPNMDKFAEKSIVFDNAYSTASHSEYAQPGVTSSRYMLANDIRNLFDKDHPKKFMWDVFKEHGYNTGYFSSQDDRWQLMDRYLDISNLDVYSYSMTDGEYDYGEGYAKKDLDHKTAKIAIEWLEDVKNKEEPFFLYMDLQGTHMPLTYTEEYEVYTPAEQGLIPTYIGERVENRYDNAMLYVDAQVGKILDFIDANNLTNNTIIAITSDHGHDVGNRHNIIGHGNSIYNEELIVPAMVFIPDTKPTRVKERVSNIDFVPTLIDLLGYKIPDEFQGEIMRENRPLFFVAQSHKYLIGMIQDDIKVIIDVNRKLIEVYNIKEDPEELHPLDPMDYEDYILRLLLWRHCQKSYYEREAWNDFKEDRCMINNNFKV